MDTTNQTAELSTSVFLPGTTMDIAERVFSRIVEAHHGMNNPPTAIDANHFANLGIVVATAFLAIAVWHRTVAAQFKRQYFVCHVFANAIVCWLT